MKILVFGNGWLGNKCAKHLNATMALGIDITDVEAVRDHIRLANPEVVINAAGKVGRPNIDWCESHKEETAYANIAGPLVIARACQENQSRFVHLSSGCLWDQRLDATEEDVPEPPSFYSYSKAAADDILMRLDAQPLILRLRMPLCGERSERNLITKVAGYQKITDLPNSMTHVDDLVSTAEALINKGASGIFNVVNPGVVTLPQIMDLYREHVDPEHSYSTISKQELLEITVAGRSDCTMTTDKLNSLGIYLPPIEERLVQCMKEYS